MQGPGKGQAGQAKRSGAAAHVLGEEGNNEAFGDIAGSTSGFPACPLCGLDPGGCLEAGRGPSMGSLSQGWVWARLPRHTLPSPGLAGCCGFHPQLAEDGPCGAEQAPP